MILFQKGDFCHIFSQTRLPALIRTFSRGYARDSFCFIKFRLKQYNPMIKYRYALHNFYIQSNLKIDLHFMADFEKKIIERVKTFRCSQQGCLSDNLDTLQLAIFGDPDLKRKGFMCTSCFIDGQLIKSLGKVEHHVLPIRKFMNVLSKQYSQYVQIKSQAAWTPNLVDEDRRQLKKFLAEMEKQLFRGIMEIVAYVEEAGTVAVQEIKKVNHDSDFQKLHDLLTEENDSEQERMEVTKELKSVSSKLEKAEGGSHKFSNEEDVRQANERIIAEFRAKVGIAELTLVRLIEVQKKGIKFLVQ